MKRAWPEVLPYHANVPAFGIWGFIVAANFPLNTDVANLPSGLRYLDPPTFRSMAVFPEDMQPVQVEPNEMIQPVILAYYREGWSKAR